jgi:hypothetical protein
MRGSGREGGFAARRLGIAAVAILLSAAFWGLMTRIWFVPLVIVLLQAEEVWSTRSVDDPPLRRFARAFVVGGMWAAIGMLVFGGPRRLLP